MNPKGFFKEPFMNIHGSIKNPKWFFAAPNLWFRFMIQGCFKEPHIRDLNMVLSKEHSKKFLCSIFWGCQYRDSPNNPKMCHLAPLLLGVYDYMEAQPLILFNKNTFIM